MSSASSPPALSLALAATGVLAVLALFACGDEFTEIGDSLAPFVTIEQPQEGDTVSARPAFRIRVSDEGSGVACESLSATIGGSDLSAEFRAGCSQLQGLVSVPAGRVTLPDGRHTLSFAISDGAGNRAVARRTFTSTAPPPHPPPSPPPT